MLDLLKYATSGFWVFIGVCIIGNALGYFVCNTIVRIFSRFMRYLMVRKHGWPPVHLDADDDNIK